jgi:hypothetical protein
MDFWAPGAYITTPTATQLHGTSFAAPHVAGIWTRLRGKFPAWTVDAAVTALNGACPSRTDTRFSPALSRKRICYSPFWW